MVDQILESNLQLQNMMRGEYVGHIALSVLSTRISINMLSIVAMPYYK